jgi:hypothetical protein
MKRALSVLLIFLSGCIVQSFYPFYTDKSKVALPQLNGEWDAMVAAFGEKQDTTNVPPWQISGDQIVAYDPNSADFQGSCGLLQAGRPNVLRLDRWRYWRVALPGTGRGIREVFTP